MEAPYARAFEGGALKGGFSANPAQTNSYVTQGTERTDAHLSSTRSRAMSSFLSTSTTVALGTADLAAARGPWALFCFKVRGARLSRVLLILSVLLDCVGASLEATNVASRALSWGFRIPAFFGFICLVVTGVGSRGMWSTKRAYFRTWSGWLDAFLLLNITVDLAYRLGVDVGWWTYTPVALAIFSVLRNLRAWSILRICRAFRSTIINLSRSANDLAAVCIFILVFSVLMLVVLLHFYGFACWYRCYPDLPLPPEVQASDSCSADSFFWDLDESQPLFCSSYISPCRGSTHCRNIFLYSVTSSCTVEERKRLQERAWQELKTNEQAGYGVFGVQTLGAAAVALLQGFTQEGWSATMQILADSDHRSNGLVAYLAFPVMVFIGSMLIMNLGIAVLWEAFDAANAVPLARPAILKESEWRVYQLLGTDWLKYLIMELNQSEDGVDTLMRSTRFVETDDAVVDESECGSAFKKAVSRYWRMTREWIKKALEIRFPEQTNIIHSFYMESRAFALRLATHKAASPMMMLVVLIDVGVLFAQSGRSTGVLLSIMDLFTSTMFVVESIVLLLAFGKRGMKDGFICLDVLIGVFAIIDGFLAVALCPNICGCRTSMVEASGFLGLLAVISTLLRPFRIFKVVKCFCSLRMTAEMVWSLHNSLMPYVMLILYSSVVVSQLGLFFFFDPNYTSDRVHDSSVTLTQYFNFESLGNALLLLFTMLTGESWHLFFKEITQVYGEDAENVSYGSNELSDFVLSTPYRVPAINTFLYFSLLFLNCLLFNLYGAIMISQFIQTQKSLSVKYAAKFIATCRNAGMPMPAEDALQGHNAQALYTQANMPTEDQRDELIKSIATGGMLSPDHAGSDRDKSAKALGEFVHKTSVVLDICKTVARRGSRMATRASSGSLSWGRDRSRSNSNSSISLASEKPQKKELLGDTAFDKAAAERGLVQLCDISADKVAGRTKQELSGLLQNNNDDGFTDIQRADERSGLQLSGIIVKSVKLGTTNKAAVKFAADDSNVVVPDALADSRTYLAARPSRPDEDLSITELCSMCWNAVKEALNQGKILVKTAAAAGLGRFTPTDPDSPLLYLAYAGHLPVAGVSPEIPLAYANLTSLGESFLSVYILTTSEGWPGILTGFLNLGGSYRWITIALCILVVALLSVFVVNLFVGIIVDVLEQEQANLEYTGAIRSATVLRWNEMQRAIFTSSLITEIVENRSGDKRGRVRYNDGFEAREWLKRIITSKQLDMAVAVISFLSCLTMLAAGAWAESDLRWSFPSYQTWIFWINAAVVLMVALFLFITIFFYGLFGTCLFYDSNVDPNQHFRFASLGESLLLLLSFSTGEVWHDTMLKIRAFYYERDSAALGWSTLPYAISFVAVAFLLLMNLFTSTVLKGYVDAKRNQSLWKVAQQQQELLNKWKLREMKLSWLPIHVAVQVLVEIPPPIGFKDLYVELGTRRMQAILANLALYPLPVHQNSVHIRDMVLTTTCRACEAHAQRRGPLAAFDLFQNQQKVELNPRLRRGPLAAFDLFQNQQKVELNPRLVSAWMNHFHDAAVTAEFNILHYLAALQIQAFWRTQRLLQRRSVPDQIRGIKGKKLMLRDKKAPKKPPSPVQAPPQTLPALS
ncbi:cation channel domain-containing protein, putative [Eimeria praecox]|uniref:Cation channel domain-containing protein, putative n=1 Tax=Eimeria praecox TaxID=51316 RepID=U6G8P1_9EIME|nr:cation channel domain-containing protein, putative [Eimeria praecox]